MAAPEEPARGATKIVFSPATVPATSASPAASIASASGVAKPGGVLMTASVSVASTKSDQRRRAAVSSLSRSRSAAPGSV